MGLLAGKFYCTSTTGLSVGRCPSAVALEKYNCRLYLATASKLQADMLPRTLCRSLCCAHYSHKNPYELSSYMRVTTNCLDILHHLRMHLMLCGSNLNIFGKSSKNLTSRTFHVIAKLLCNLLDISTCYE